MVDVVDSASLELEASLEAPPCPVVEVDVNPSPPRRSARNKRAIVGWDLVVSMGSLDLHACYFFIVIGQWMVS